LSGAWTIAGAAVAGLALGSFAVTAGVRASRFETAWGGRSRCDDCGATLSFARTIPILSFARTNGRCADCGSRIDPVHLAGEVTGAMVLAMSASLTPPRAVLLAVVGLALIALTAIDARVQRLPNALCAVVAMAGAGLALEKGGLALALGAATACSLGLLLLGLRQVARRGGRDPGLGLGDVKLIAGLSFWLGLSAPWMLGGAAAAALVFTTVRSGRDRRLPFGPFLAVAAWIVGMGMEWGWWRTI